MTRLALFLLLLLPLAACDSADPGPEAASISIALGAITANSNCDSATNPGDFQFLIEVTDLGNNPIEAITLPAGATYGTHSAAVIPLFSGNQATVGQTISLQQPRAEGSGFAVSLSGMEWDSTTRRDANMDDRTSVRTHRFASGQFSSVVGTQQLSVGNGACNATLDYVVTVQ
ncbi:hypothetical protein B1759_10505 [Rubrivirga sp. SAORIC476]|uniref:hypothetical protein n=1 Tax=Rubrivirga sp. SAORIC476 TaxID=1961794 RepID=UPI000BA93883|nr:hypothetical protein [Rubrivirga sp. SAORIC476]PAP81718.1 hypothetical protein B1759_10505 [Rubrivirga sp. SAORIC476]